MNRVLGSANGKIMVRLNSLRIHITTDFDSEYKYDGEVSLDYFESLSRTIKDYYYNFNPRIVRYDKSYFILELIPDLNRIVIYSSLSVEDILDYFTKKFKEN